MASKHKHAQPQNQGNTHLNKMQLYQIGQN